MPNQAQAHTDDLREFAIVGARLRLAELRNEVARLEAFLRFQGERVPRHSVNGGPPGPGAAAPALTPAGWSQKRPAKPKRSPTLTIEQRAAAARRMRRLWKTKRAVMLKGARKGSKNGRKVRRKAPDAASSVVPTAD